MDLRILFWNVEHFTGKGRGARADRVARVADLIAGEDPDIFALMEVSGASVFTEFTARFPGYTFSVTEGTQVQEILIGVRGGLTAFFTQRNEFKRSNPNLRPAALLSVTTPGEETLSLLFSHLKSLPSPEGFGLRDAMFDKVRGLKKAIDRASDGQGKFILLGDLNTMGLNMTYSDADMTGDEEIARLDRILAARDLLRQTKTHPHTFNNGSASSYPPADLDHVYATPNLDFADQGQGATVRVAGWAEAADADAWITSYSDHAPLIFELRGL
ncbi:endonuclease/exonuclease/phosphatase family protein [Aestuariivita sp.]|jgi:endonuclease/exonuclease/phosphatase family metal-dependent hydrolase|uniref:endonuclease/exonuclease/phosphatase family protein n=1 Tax=Aestuariivita sp. TaxID=1872407 RepID=UPI00216C0D9E|nr:endonuclease/exonuclease/phosphatase family protein [Aestuariivita sp.]MCE8005746.1 endonuclease/exonuclease/phosphatase family protein [Aestuariivita sp.]